MKIVRSEARNFVPNIFQLISEARAVVAGERLNRSTWNHHLHYIRPYRHCNESKPWSNHSSHSCEIQIHIHIPIRAGTNAGRDERPIRACSIELKAVKTLEPNLLMAKWNRMINLICSLMDELLASIKLYCQGIECANDGKGWLCWMLCTMAGPLEQH